jgi:hypothetical protein
LSANGEGGAMRRKHQRSSFGTINPLKILVP